MAKKLFEISIRIIVDDKNEKVMNDLKDFYDDIHSGSLQRELIEEEGILDAKLTLKEIRK